MLEQLDVELNAQGVHMALVEMRIRLQDLVQRDGLFETFDRDRFSPPSIPESLRSEERSNHPRRGRRDPFPPAITRHRRSEGKMTNPNSGSAEETAEAAYGSVDQPESADVRAFASVVLSTLSFLTLLRLADRRDRTPARAVGLFIATTTESITGATLGLITVTQTRDDRPNRNFLLGAAGLVLGVITTLLNFNWMRTRRRM
jgi:hypothetical protein